MISNHVKKSVHGWQRWTNAFAVHTLIGCSNRRSFSVQLRQSNEEVRLAYLHLQQSKEKQNKPMIVLHGLLGGMKNWRSLCKQQAIISKRDCFLVEQRNHASSDHHMDMNYQLMSDDILRFADRAELQNFTLLGHSMGARAAMTTACRYPDRVDGVISVDSAPVNEATNNAYIGFTYSVVKFMYEQKDAGITTQEALERAADFFKDKPEIIHMIKGIMNLKSENLQWKANVEGIYNNFQNIPYFDESLRYPKSTVYHLVGEKSVRYQFMQYMKVFPHIKAHNVIVVKGAGHWVHFDKPLETIEHVSNFLDDIDHQTDH